MTLPPFAIRAGWIWLAVFLCHLSLAVGDVRAQAPTYPVVTAINLFSNDIAYDPGTQKIYVSVSINDTSAYKNTVTPLDPVTGLFGTPIAVGSNPGKLALSGDNQFLYVGLDNANAIDRITLALQTVSLQIGQTGVPGDIKVLPGFPHSIAVDSTNGLAIFDDNVPRPATVPYFFSSSSIVFGPSPNILYGVSSSTLDRFTITSGGATLLDTTANVFQFAGEIVYQDGLLWGSDGNIVDPVLKYRVNSLPDRGVVCADPARNRVYYLYQAFNSFSGSYTTILYSFNATTYQLVASDFFNNLSGTPVSLIRCGGNRLAFLSQFSQVLIVTDPNIVPSVVGLTLPASTIKGAGTLPSAGTVTVSEAQATDVVVSLASSNSSKITVPATVTIPAGQLSAAFDVTVVDNHILDGPQTAIISASATGFDIVTGAIEVDDNEPASFTVTLPTAVTQGTTVQGTVTISAVPAANIVVALSSNSSSLLVPATVTIPAGQTSVTFTATVEEAGGYVGPQGATVTAHVDNWTDGSTVVSMVDGLDLADWPSFGNGAAHAGYQAITTGNRQYEPGWSFTYHSSSGEGFREVAVSNGIAYVVPGEISSYSDAFLSALDVNTGQELWRHPFGQMDQLSAPTIDAGGIYLQSGSEINGTFTGYLWHLNPASGTEVAESSINSSFGGSIPPTVINGETWLDTGVNGSLCGFDTNGFEQFSTEFLGNSGGWMPASYEGTFYTWAEGTFRAQDPASGALLWFVIPSASDLSTAGTPAIAQGTAFVIGASGLYAVALGTHGIAWSVSGSFRGTPAAANGTVYALSSGNVLAYNAQTGALVGTYATSGTSLDTQPIVTNDSLIVTSTTNTYIFNLQTSVLIQTIPYGGAASLANGVLYITGSDQTLRTFQPAGLNLITLSLPASISEGGAPASGTVTLSQASPTDTVVTLTASDTAHVTIPASVTVPANQTSATFPLSATNSALIYGSENVIVTATGPTFLFGAGTTSVTVSDSQPVVITLSTSAPVTEGNNLKVTLTLSAAPSSNVTVSLVSSDTTALLVPPAVTVLAGQTSITFNVTAVDDGVVDGTRTPTITAQVGNWTSGTVPVTVLDDGRNAALSWPTYGNGPTHSGFQPITTGGALYQTGWTVPYPTASQGLNQTAIAGGMIFATPYNGTFISALDAFAGVEIWRDAYVAVCNPPTVDSGSVYVQNSDGSLFCLNASSGATLWDAPFTTQGGNFYAPTVAAGGVWMNGGEDGGLYGFNTSDGSQRFFDANFVAVDQWTPAYYNGVVYTWVGGQFQAQDTSSGTVLWTLSLDTGSGFAYDADTAPAINGGQAFVIGYSGLFAIDLWSNAPAWSAIGSFTGTPAATNDTVFAISGSNVLAYSSQTGAQVGTYGTGDTAIAGQPIVTNDTLIVTSATNVYIFNRSSQTLLQTLPFGGVASLANNILYLAGGDGTLRSYYPTGLALADTSITQTMSPTSAGSGAPVTMTLTAGNAGPATAPSVVVADLLPSGLTFLSATSSQGTCSQSGGVVTCNLGDLAVGASATVTITATSNGASNQLNTAIVTSGDYDPNNGNNSASAVLNPIPPTITTQAAYPSGVGASLNGSANANGLDTAVFIDYGTTTAYGTAVPAYPIFVTGTTVTSLSTYLTNLAPNTIYHYRARGVSAAGSVAGADMTFTTQAAEGVLNALSVSPGTLTPAFASALTNYTVSVLASTEDILIVTSSPYYVQLSVTDNSVPIGGSLGDEFGVGLSLGNNDIAIVVSAQDGSSSTYHVVVTRGTAPPSLSNLALSAGSLVPGFGSGTTSYTTSVSNATSTVTVTPTAADSTSTISVNGVAVVSGSASGSFNLAVGSNTINTIVTSQDGSLSQTYTVNVTRRTPYQDWATGLGLGGTALDPLGDFNGDGLKNILKWAFSIDTTSSTLGAIEVNGNTLTAHGTPTLLAYPNGSGGTNYFALFGVRMDAVAAALTYTVEFSADLINWTVSTAPPSVVAQDGVIQAVTVPFPGLVNGVPPKYFHVKVSGQ